MSYIYCYGRLESYCNGLMQIWGKSGSGRGKPLFEMCCFHGQCPNSFRPHLCQKGHRGTLFRMLFFQLYLTKRAKKCTHHPVKCFDPPKANTFQWLPWYPLVCHAYKSTCGTRIQKLCFLLLKQSCHQHFWKAQGVAVRPRRLFFLSYGYKIASVS